MSAHSRDAASPGKAGSTLRSSACAPTLLSSAPGKVTLTQLLDAEPRRAPPARVADAKQDEAQLNAVLEVVVIDDRKVIQQWQSRARWEGPLPVRWTATRAGGRWTWDSADARSLRVQTDDRGRGGKALEAWAQPSADRIIVHVHATGDVTIDSGAEPDALPPGHARREQDAGDGSADKLADAFERELGIAPDGDPIDGEDEATTGATSGGNTPGGEGTPGGDPDGRTGDDTRMGGTGPGGDKARPDGHGNGSESGRAGGSEGGSQDGQQGGPEGGMYGGKGKPGDDGVPSGSGLLGGLIGIPAALKGLIEVALIIADGNIIGAGAGLFRKGLGKIASASAARRMIASEARRAAVKETKAAIKAITADKVKGPIWNAATKAERDAATRRIYWELQRTYFDAYRKAAKQAKREAQAALDKSAGNVAAQQKLKNAELAEEATDVMPVAGRLPQNHDYAGQAFPSHLLPQKYRSKGLRFTKEGYPDFAPHGRQLPNGKNYVEIEYTGSRRADAVAANKKAKLDQIPKGWTWHHAEDMKTMYLVPDELHKAVKHSGGIARYKHGSGVPKYGK